MGASAQNCADSCSWLKACLANKCERTTKSSIMKRIEVSNPGVDRRRQLQYHSCVQCSCLVTEFEGVGEKGFKGERRKEEKGKDRPGVVEHTLGD
eukprot:1136264-Pelagomonas_calceolata.AAC.3